MGNKTVLSIIIILVIEALLTRVGVTDGIFMPLVVRVLGALWALPV